MIQQPRKQQLTVHDDVYQSVEHSSKGFVTSWQPSEQQVRDDGHDSMVDQLQSGDITLFLSGNEEKGIGKFGEFGQKVQMTSTGHSNTGGVRMST